MVAGIGSALIDILIHEENVFLDRVGATKGGMIYVTKEEIDRALSLSGHTPMVSSGGSACNTVVGIGRLGGDARFVGKCGTGEMAALFESDLRKNGVEPVLFRSEQNTGRVLSVVTPDAQRSMLTCLGASAETAPGDIGPGCFDGAGIVHVEGYLLFNRDLITAAMEAAAAAGAKVSLDLASFNVVAAARDFLSGLIGSYVDILIANEDEAHAYTGLDDEGRMLARMAETVDVAVLKLGERGSMIAAGGSVYRIDPVQGGGIVDTTGAGDLWAAGFLYGHINGYDMADSGWFGSICGYEVCRGLGARVSDDGWARIISAMDRRKPS